MEQEHSEGIKNKANVRYDDGPCTAGENLVHEVLELSDRIDLRASPKRFRRSPCFGLTDDMDRGEFQS